MSFDRRIVLVRGNARSTSTRDYQDQSQPVHAPSLAGTTPTYKTPRAVRANRARVANTFLGLRPEKAPDQPCHARAYGHAQDADCAADTSGRASS